MERNISTVVKIIVLIPKKFRKRKKGCFDMPVREEKDSYKFGKSDKLYKENEVKMLCLAF